MSNSEDYESLINVHFAPLKGKVLNQCWWTWANKPLTLPHWMSCLSTPWRILKIMMSRPCNWMGSITTSWMTREIMCKTWKVWLRAKMDKISTGLPTWSRILSVSAIQMNNTKRPASISPLKVRGCNFLLKTKTIEYYMEFLWNCYVLYES